jgi:hypothetical protein
MSKSTFKRYNTDIIVTNIHRINSLRLSDVFVYDLISLSIWKLSEFWRLETLILHNIESEHLEIVLKQLTSLSLLSSLTITSVDNVRNRNPIYRQIFRLPALKYCKLSLKGWASDEPLPIASNEYSSIENFITSNYMCLDEVDSLLSYVPQLRRLSLHSLRETWKKRTKAYQLVLNHLTHISLQLDSIQFDQFEQMVINIFPTVQILHLTAQGYSVDPAYIDANKWKQLISSHIPNLRIFDLEIDLSASNTDDQLRIETQINQFTSPFWIERQWFFAHHFYRSIYGNRAIFYSTNPYRYQYITFLIRVVYILIFVFQTEVLHII